MMCSLDFFVDSESIARVIDVFADSLNLAEIYLGKVLPAKEGRPDYGPGAVLKLYLYGNQKSSRSSSKLAEACRINVGAK